MRVTSSIIAGAVERAHTVAANLAAASSPALPPATQSQKTWPCERPVGDPEAEIDVPGPGLVLGRHQDGDAAGADQLRAVVDPVGTEGGQLGVQRGARTAANQVASATPPAMLARRRSRRRLSGSGRRPARA